MNSAIDKIRELRALHEDGLLSRDEFDERKNAILDAAYAPAAAAPGATLPVEGGTEIGLMTGQEIGPRDRRYRLERLVAHGGMGQVWQATDLATHAELGHSAQVALKILPPSLTRGTRHAKLLVEEATRARRLAHEHIVRVYEWAQDPATASYFIIMEYLDGEDLDSLLRREGALPLARVLDLLGPVARALDYAWDKHRLVHRDIKPGNVFVTKGGEVKLLDFGIAARARAGGAGLEAPAGSGTSGYRAPEGLSRRPPERTLDVYSVGVMIWQMVQGALPAARARQQQPDALSPAQWRVLRAALAPDPAARPASVGELVAAMREPAAAAGVPQAPGASTCTAQSGIQDEPVRHLPVGSRLAGDLPIEHISVVDIAVGDKSVPDAPVRNGHGNGTPVRPKPAAVPDVAARELLARQRKERERAERAAAEARRRARKEALREQLRERRALEAEKARIEREEAQRKAQQAQAAAAYRAEQERARAERAAHNEAALKALLPTPDSPVAGPDGVLRDRFADGGAGPELVLIPTGRFLMGSPPAEREAALAAGARKAWVARETPQHLVEIDRPIAMGRYPVTVAEWREFARSTGWRGKGDASHGGPGFAQDERHPMVGVSWHDAQQYLRWLSQQSGRTYRLPSEAEWEYCCRAGTTTPFCFGDAIGTAQANYDGRFTWGGGKTGAFRRGTTPVGRFVPNQWGLYDMHGNVWEWVQDTVHDNYEGAPADGSAWVEGGDEARRVLRGGAWRDAPRHLRSALRNGFAAGLSSDIVGFRVVRELM